MPEIIDSGTLRKAREFLLSGQPAKCRAEIEKNLHDNIPEKRIPVLSPEEAANVAIAMDMLGRASFQMGKGEEGLSFLQQGASFLDKYIKQNDSGKSGNLLSLLVGLWQNAAFAALELKSCALAQKMLDSALELAKTVYPPEDPEMAALFFSVSNLHYRLGQWDDAEKYTLMAKNIWENPQKPNPEKAATCMNNLGRIYEERGDMEAGIAWHKQAVAARRMLPNGEDLAFSLGNLGVALAQGARWREAVEALEESLSVYRKEGLGASRECLGYAANLEICRKALENGE